MPSCCLTAATCLPERQRAMRQNGPFGWSDKCMNCVEGAARQLDQFKPEPDVDSSDMRRNRIDPRDFEETQPVRHLERRGPKHKTHCSKGHPYSKHGSIRPDGSNRCRICAAVNKNASYARKKEAT